MHLAFKPTVDETMRRFEAFWGGAVADRPPIRVRYPVPGATDENWPKASQDPSTLGDYWENVCKARADFPDDEVPALHLDMGPGYMGGVMGSPVRYEHGTTWSEHSLRDWSGLEQLRDVAFDDSNSWVRKLIDGARLFSERAQGRCAVGAALMMGPGDIATALRGPGEVCVDIYEEPARARELLKIAAEAWIRVALLQFDTVPDFRGGFIDNYNIWTPGRSTYFAEDISNLFSPEAYRDFLYPFDCVVAEALDNPWMHVHSGGARLVPEFLQIPGLRGVQIVNDRPAGPAAEELIPIFKMIQRRHLLFLRKYSPEELGVILPHLAPERLYVDTQADNREEAQAYLDTFSKRYR